MNIERRYDIDWLRVIAIGLLVLYHVAISFQPWGSFFGFLISSNNLEVLWGFMSIINIWRIPILFFISGMGVYFAMQKRDWNQLLKERAIRILVPLVFASFTIVALQNYLQQLFYNQSPVKYVASVAHLWFLVNILIYVLLLSPIFYHLKDKSKLRIVSFFQTKLAKPALVYIFIVPYLLEAILINPESYTLYLFSPHGFVLGGIVFFLGYYFVLIGRPLFEALKMLILPSLTMALGLYMIRIIVYKLEAPNWLIAIESMLWMYTAFGIAFKYWNKNSKTLSYLSAAVYPVYIIHFLVQNALCYAVLKKGLNGWIEFGLVLVGTYVVSFLIYEFLIRRIPYWRKLFGLK